MERQKSRPSVWDRIFETSEQYKARTRAESSQIKSDAQRQDNTLNKDKELPLSERMRLLQKGAMKR